ncbi:YciI family protein [Marinimicrobium sp. ABcell2]|uniref:YciI family protein n=1 Tax=Marinimicrobium sp. ABcell2 TaxID=3069751 RepID=UPI0027B6FFF8|nr:YciI family protein [Marinimicrobium sp. ABcell2]MDQ2076696.1 YciI family protein [Marinimicrobium sp. ABcell2]
MKCMVFMKANADSEAGVLPGEQVLSAMGDFNEQLNQAGILLSGEGLKPSSEGVRLAFSGDGRVLTSDGPFAETKEIVAGYWLWEVPNMDAAVEWASRIPNPEGDSFEVEIRPLYTAEDFGETFTQELRDQEERLRQKLTDRH